MLDFKTNKLNNPDKTETEIFHEIPKKIIKKKKKQKIKINNNYL